VAYRNKRTREQFGQKLSRRSGPGKKIRRYPGRHHKTKVVEPSRNYTKRRKPVDVSRIRAERKRIQRTQKRWKKAVPGAKIRGYPVRRHKSKEIEPSNDYIKRRKPADVSRIRTERRRVQRTEKRRERAGVRGTRPERKILQIPEGRNSPFHGVGKESYKRKVNKRGFQRSQRGDMRYRGGNLQRQGSGFRGRSGT